VAVSAAIPNTSASLKIGAMMGMSSAPLFITLSHAAYDSGETRNVCRFPALTAGVSITMTCPQLRDGGLVQVSLFGRKDRHHAFIRSSCYYIQ
jgi:hypothetical protein